MHRLLIAPGELAAEVPNLSHEVRAHLKVLRPKPGERFQLFDGSGRWRFATYCDGAVRADSEIFTAPRPRPLTLFACVTKGSRWDWTLEKATELGVTRIVPVISDRTIVRIAAEERDAKRQRWLRIVEDAARQSCAIWLPEVCAPISFAESLALVVETDCYVGALANPPPKRIGSALARRTGERKGGLAVYVGPEGDFTPEELAALVACATPVSFGSTVLRAETAAIYGVSALKTALDSEGE